MAVQFNLLPDIKLEFDRQQRAKRLVFTIAFLSSAVVLAIFAVSFISVNILQKKLLNDANANINNYSQKLKAIPNLEKILTIQNQLNSLPALHQQKHYTSRLFSYLPQVTPANVHIGKLTVDTTASTITISGTADTVQSVNRFVDTLKNSAYVVNGVANKVDCEKQSGKWLSDSQQCTKLAFSNIILTKIDRDDKGAIYTVDSSYDTALFSGTKAVVLVVPKETTTQSVVNTPKTPSLFNGETGDKDKTNEQGSQ